MWEENLNNGERAAVLFSSGIVELQQFNSDTLQITVIRLPMRTWHGVMALIESLFSSGKKISQPIHLTFGDVHLSVENNYFGIEHEGQVIEFREATQRWAFLHSLELGRQVLADPTITACQILVTSGLRETGKILAVARATEPIPSKSLPSKTTSLVTDADVNDIHEILSGVDTLDALLKKL